MKEIKAIEIAGLSEEHREKHSSYDPADYIPCVNVGVIGAEERQQNSHDHQVGNTSEMASGCGDCCRYLPAHYFDYIGGTSTGGLISIMLGRLRMSVEDCMSEYEKLSGDIFGHPRWASVRGPIPWLRDKYDGKTIQRAVEDVMNRRMSPAERRFGTGNFSSPPGLCRTVVFAYASKISNELSEYSSSGKGKQAADSEDSAPYIFRSYDHWAAEPPVINERNPGVAHSVAIWEAARATTSAPFYFDPIKISNRKFGDGGFGNNNPAEEMRTEVSCMNGNDPKSIALLLSIGTGEIPITRLEQGPLRKYIGYVNAARKLASDAEAAHQRLEGWKADVDLPYYRFNVPEGLGLDKIKLDEWKTPMWYNRCQKTTLDAIREATDKYCAKTDVRARLKDVAKILVDHRNSRKDHCLWPFVSRGEQYRCTFKKCRGGQELKPRREDLAAHLREKHNLGENRVLLETYLEKGVVPPTESKKGSRVSTIS